MAVAAVRALDFNDCLYICIGGGGDGRSAGGSDGGGDVVYA